MIFYIILIFIIFIVLIFFIISSFDSNIQENNDDMKIIHFVYGLWADNPNKLPDFAIETINSWKKHLPCDWKIKIWTKEESWELINRDVELSNICKEVSRKVMIADIVRCLILYYHGGFYVDLDCKLVNNVFKILNSLHNKSTVLFQECTITSSFANQIALRQSIRNGHPEDLIRIANYAFGSFIIHNPFFNTCIENIKKRWIQHPYITNDYEILYISGPDLITHVYHHLTDEDLKTNILLLPSHSWLHHVATGTWRSNKDS